FLSFDERQGIVECEAGVSFAEIIRHLRPRGWCLPTTPGTQYVTVGGAIAADVHGKNHHMDGSFNNCVLEFKLLTAAGDLISCSRVQNADVFWASLGGMGLTGVIVSARIQMRHITSAYCNVTYRRRANLDETLESFSRTDHSYRYSVAWIDCLSSGASLGRSVLMLGNDAEVSDLPEPLRDQPLVLPAKKKHRVPFNLPSCFLNSWSVKAFNTLYYASHRDSHRFVDYDTFFYPLDHVRSWNRIYGQNGFVQY